MLTILHAADFHLDSPFRSLPAAEAALRRREQRRLLEDLRDLALERRVDLCLLAGDLFDSQEVYPETLDLLARVLGELPCPVVIAPGNHDFWSDRSPYALRPWPENVHIFRSEAVTPLPFPELGVTVYGCAFTSPFRTDDPLARFRAPDDGSLAVGLIHGEVAREGRYAPMDPSSIAGSGLAYLALGHVHAATCLHTEQPVPWAFSGCPQGRGFDELGDKGVFMLRFENGKLLPPLDPVDGAFMPLPGPRYFALSIPLSEDRDPAEALREALGDSYRNDYLRLTLTGTCPAPDLPALRAVGGALCRSIELRDETERPADLWGRMGEDTLTGLFLREMKERLDHAPDEDARRQVELAVRYGLAALEGRDDPT